MKKNLVLLGMMGVGKSTLGKMVSKKLKLNFLDIDRFIEKKNLMTINEIFKTKGENFFRNEEEKITLKFLKKQKLIIALGGGAFINRKIRNEVLLNNISIWLSVDIGKLSIRVSKSNKRPLLNENKKSTLKVLEKIYEKRKKIYELANHKIDCDKSSLNKIANDIISIYEKY